VRESKVRNKANEETRRKTLQNTEIRQKKKNDNQGRQKKGCVHLFTLSSLFFDVFLAAHTQTQIALTTRIIPVSGDWSNSPLAALKGLFCDLFPLALQRGKDLR
jgi:hypothetical protein